MKVNWYREAQIAENDSSWKVFWKSDGKFKIFKVDGNYIRNNIEVEFTLGGHHLRYKFVPDNEVWIENLSSEFDMESNLLHELTEIGLMEKGMKYEDAHERAAETEKEHRVKNTEEKQK